MDMLGWADANDRRFKIVTPWFEGVITEYNDELTGFDQRLANLDPDVFRYGGNAYYITGSYARSKGYVVEEIERKK